MATSTRTTIRGTTSRTSGPHRIRLDRGRIWEGMPADAGLLYAGDEQNRIRHFGPDFSHVVCADVTADDTDLVVGQYMASYDVTAAGAGSAAIASTNGALAITTDTADNDLCTVIFNGGGGVGSALETVGPFTPVAGSTIRFGAEIKIGALIATSAIYVGLTVDAAFAEDDETINYIAIKATNGSVSLRRAKADTAEATTLLAPDGSSNLTADTYAQVGFVVRGVTALEGYHDGFRTEESDVTSLPVVPLYPFIHVEAKAAVIRTGTVRRLTVTQEIV